MSAQREAFEAHVLIWWRAINRDSTGDYVAAGTSDAWELWQAAQAAMPVPASRVPMTEEQAASFLDAWATSSGSLKLIGLIRAIESHHGIGTKS